MAATVGTPDHNDGCLWRSPLTSQTMAWVPAADSSFQRRRFDVRHITSGATVERNFSTERGFRPAVGQSRRSRYQRGWAFLKSAGMPDTSKGCSSTTLHPA